MNQTMYYTITNSELHDRILLDEITKANEARRQHEEFVSKNNALHK